MSVNPAEVVAGLLLLFFVPGYAMTKAIFPEWRVRGPTATLRLLEITTLSFVTSLVLAVLVGYFLLVAGPNGFQAYWSDPILEAVLAGIAAIAFGLGWYRGAYRRTPPTSLPPEPGEERGTWETVEELDRLRREERRVRHELRRAGTGSTDSARLRSELERIQSEAAELRSRREAEYGT
ncbi:MAG: DUF1616 domain-containing protein [Thermoplasmata archaeon]